MMSSDNVPIRGADKSLGLVFEGKIVCRYRQATHDWHDDAVPYKAGHAIIGPSDLMAVVHRIPPKKLVAAIASESDGDVPPYELRKHESRYQRTIGQRFIEPSSNFTDQVGGCVHAEGRLVV